MGLAYDEYTDLVGDARVAYDQMDTSSLSSRCARIGAQAEKALNGYTKAAEVWNDCIADINCENDSIKPGLQRRWEQASIHVGVFKIGVNAEKSEGRDKGAADQECKKRPDLPGCK